MESDENLPSCPCCGRSDWWPRWPGFVICRECGLMTVNERFDAADLKRVYQEDYFHGREYVNYLADKPSQQRTLKRHLGVVQRYVPPGGRLLETGCAYGFFLELIQKSYPGSIGIDVSSAGIAHARALGLDAREGDLLTLQLAETFDAVCLWDTIEHLPFPYETMKKSCELLKPGGYLFLTTGDFGALLPRLQGKKWRQIHPPTHLFYFTRKSLNELCRRVGLGVIRFGTATVHRRVGSTLRYLQNFYATSFTGRAAGLVARVSPKSLMNLSFPMNLGDTLYLVARKS